MELPIQEVRHRYRYLVAVLVTLTAMVVRLVYNNWLYSTSPFLFFTPAVMLAAWYGGLGPGLLATAASAVVANYFLIAPTHAFSLRSDDITRAVLFSAVGIQISWLSGAMYTARRREEDTKAARHSEKLYRTLARNFPDGFVCLFDGALRWTLVEGAGLEAAGLSREQLESHYIADTLPAPAAALLHALCEQAASGNAGSLEITHRRRIYLSHALPLRTRDGMDHVGMIILQDITDRAHARESLQWAHDNLERRVQDRTSELNIQKSLLESLSQASADGILAIGNDGIVFFANRRFKEIWRLDAPQSLNEIRDYMRYELESPHDPLSNQGPPLSTNDENVEEMILRDGRSIERYSAPIIDPAGVSYGTVWFFRDITERKHMQGQILEAGERERQRIGQDLHDDLCQQLTGISCLARLLQQRLSHRSSDEHEADAAGEIVQMVQSANQRAHDLAKGLQPVNLMRQGLAAALQELCDSMTAIFRISCVFQGSETGMDLEENLSIQLYRIVQEALNNAIRHGRASNVHVDMVLLEGRMILTVEDDGVGISVPLPQAGLGLYTMNYRARLVRGVLEVERVNPSGTRVTCSIPLKIDTPLAPGVEAESIV